MRWCDYSTTDYSAREFQTEPTSFESSKHAACIDDSRASLEVLVVHQKGPAPDPEPGQQLLLQQPLEGMGSPRGPPPKSISKIGGRHQGRWMLGAQARSMRSPASDVLCCSSSFDYQPPHPPRLVATRSIDHDSLLEGLVHEPLLQAGRAP